eukprot:3033993-Rhodomonas_salina.2
MVRQTSRLQAPRRCESVTRVWTTQCSLLQLRGHIRNVGDSLMHIQQLRLVGEGARVGGARFASLTAQVRGRRWKQLRVRRARQGVGARASVLRARAEAEAPPLSERQELVVFDSVSAPLPTHARQGRRKISRPIQKRRSLLSGVHASMEAGHRRAWRGDRVPEVEAVVGERHDGGCRGELAVTEALPQEAKSGACRRQHRLDKNHHGAHGCRHRAWLVALTDSAFQTV